MAFDYFKTEKVDIAVVETGLGGRLDSTNILNPIVSVITNISLDHQNMLGNTEYEIAHEKAGIIKSRTPVVIGLYQASCDQVFLSKAKETKSKIEFASLRWNKSIQGRKVTFSCSSRGEELELELNRSPPFYWKISLQLLNQSIHSGIWDIILPISK